MFLMALTKNVLKDRFPTHRVLEYDCTPLVATLITDGSICRHHVNQDGFAIVQTLPGQMNLDERTVLGRIEYRKAQKGVTLHRGTRAGLPIYYRFESGELYCSSHIALLRQAGVPIRESSRAL